MKPKEEIRRIRERFEHITRALDAQTTRFLEDRVHISVFIGGDYIYISFCPHPDQIDIYKTQVAAERHLQWHKSEIWIPRPDLGYYQRLRYCDKEWHAIFPVPLSLDPPKKHLGNRPQNGKSKIYFVLNEEKELVKIGVSANPRRRLYELKSHNADKLKLLEIIPIESSDYTEYELHKKFKHLRKYGEWFFYTDEIKSFLTAEANHAGKSRQQAIEHGQVRGVQNPDRCGVQDRAGS